ncbi:hypothetical protein FOVSG1_009154 [Fusarium oxysporum f. sp. vasinfectum]
MYGTSITPQVVDAIARKLYGDDAVRHNKRKPRETGQSTIKYSTVQIVDDGDNRSAQKKQSKLNDKVACLAKMS